MSEADCGEFFRHLAYVLLYGPQPVEIGVVGQGGGKAPFGEEVYLRTGLLAEAADDRGGQDNVTNGTKAEEKNAHGGKIKPIFGPGG